MQVYARYHVEVHPRKKKEVLYLVKKKIKKKKKEKHKNNGTLWIYKLWSLNLFQRLLTQKWRHVCDKWHHLSIQRIWNEKAEVVEKPAV